MENRIHEKVISAIKSSGLTYQEIADGSGVNKRTVEKIARREIDDPGVSHIEKLADFLCPGEGRTPRRAARAQPSNPT